jgi:Cu-Zn family superoxide dismutase
MSRTMIAGALLASVALLAGSAHAQTQPKASSAKASADFVDAAGKKVGEAILEQQDGAVEIKATFTGVPPGTRAFHIHEVGKCEAPFESAGGHFNPAGRKHGKDNPGGPHAGDLPNITIPASGRATVEVTVKDISLDGGRGGLLDGDGAALVVHEGTDDYKSDPAGNAGKRLACAVIKR